MRTKIYEYGNGIDGICFKENHICDFDGRGCFELEVEIPDDLKPYRTASDHTAVEISDQQYLLNEILRFNQGSPTLLLPKLPNPSFRNLKVYSRTEKSTSLFL